MATAPLALPIMLRQRFAALTPRERAFLGVGAAALLAFLLYLMLRGGEEGPVELTAQPPPPAPVAAPVPYVPPPPPAASIQPAASAAGLTLIGIFGGGPGGGAAVIAMGGVQRTIPVGREFQPGLSLKAVGIDHVILGSASGDQRLELGKSGTTSIAPAPTAVPGAPAAPAQSEAIRKAETNAYRIGLEPVKTNGSIAGHRIRAGARLPHLDRAGLVPGDVILRVNGSALNEEQLMELSWTIANSAATEFEVMRGGRKMKLALQR